MTRRVTGSEVRLREAWLGSWGQKRGQALEERGAASTVRGRGTGTMASTLPKADEAHRPGGLQPSSPSAPTRLAPPLPASLGAPLRCHLPAGHPTYGCPPALPRPPSGPAHSQDRCAATGRRASARRREEQASAHPDPFSHHPCSGSLRELITAASDYLHSAPSPPFLPCPLSLGLQAGAGSCLKYWKQRQGGHVEEKQTVLCRTRMDPAGAAPRAQRPFKARLAAGPCWERSGHVHRLFE